MQKNCERCVEIMQTDAEQMRKRCKRVAETEKRYGEMQKNAKLMWKRCERDVIQGVTHCV